MTRELLKVISIFIGISLIIFILNWVQSYVFLGIQGYLGAESQWAKAQRDSVFHLQNYTYTNNEEDYLLFEDSLSVILGDRQARLSVLGDELDFTSAYDGFLKGKNQPEEIPAMIKLLYYFHSLPHINEAIIMWKEGDEVINSMKALSKEIRNAIKNNAPYGEFETYRKTLNVLSYQATYNEEMFSKHFSDGAHFVMSLVFYISIFLYVVLIIIGAIASKKIIRGINETIQREKDVITQSKEKTDRLIERFNEAMLATQDGIWDWDTVTNEVYYNPAWQTMLGYKVGELKQHLDTFVNLLHPEDLDKTMEHAQDFINNKFNEYRIEFRMLCKDGSYKWVLARAKASKRDKDGKATKIIGTHVDIQARKEYEKELLKDILQKDALLIQQSRLAQMGEMISMIAHQWRQPLSTISANIIDIQIQKDLGILKLEEDDKNYIEERIDSMNNCVKNLSTTIDDFRNFYKPNQVKVKKNFKTVVENSMSIIEGSMKNSNIELIYNYDSYLEMEMHDREIIQVILNVLKNAQDALIEREVKNPIIKISTKGNSLSICDNGGGISDNIKDNIFDPYFSTKSEKNGTGLGLYMSKMIIDEHHNGKISVENIADGVCFTIELYD